MPELEIVFEAPVMVILLGFAQTNEFKLLTVILPQSVNVLVLVIVPAITNSFNTIPAPEITLLMPVIVTMPLPPHVCVNVPVPVVVKFPEKLRLIDAAAVIPVLDKVRL